MIEWRKSTRSNSSGGACVEIANLDGHIGLRDSKAPHTGHLTLTTEDFATLIARVKQGD